MAGNNQKFQNEISSELNKILEYWKQYGVDEKNGGFVGRRDHQNKEIEEASKGIILNTRILWTFSAIGNFKQEAELKFYADRAFDYLKNFFWDREFQGVFWELDAHGNPVNKRKQIYAQAFAIYALSEYYLFSEKEEAKEMALTIFRLIEQNARDFKFNGYLEAFQEDWSPIEDMRLSEKDRNSAKTMNTHLHILEAYTTLFHISGSKMVREALENLIGLFVTKFYDMNNQHFRLFFDDQWKQEGNVVSYGHDIETAWVLIEAAKAIENNELLKKTEKMAVSVAKTFHREAYVEKAGVINERDLDTGEVDEDRHWWPQIEAMVGLDYAYKISGNENFEAAQRDIWDFTKQHIIDHENGEWFFRIDKNNKPYTEEDKVGMWKCPYHNSRGCILLLRNQ